MTKHHLLVAAALALAIPLPAAAQASADDPAKPRRAVPALRYDSAFADYKPWRDTRPADWRALNDAPVNDAQQGGGRTGHAAPAAASAPAFAPASAAPRAPAASNPAAGAAPAAAGHHGTHRMQGARQ